MCRHLSYILAALMEHPIRGISPPDVVKVVAEMKEPIGA